MEHFRTILGPPRVNLGALVASSRTVPGNTIMEYIRQQQGTAPNGCGAFQVAKS